MHFQIGSSAQDKLIFVHKEAIDVIVDVREGSTTFNKPFSIELNEGDSKSIFIKKGYAHGFYLIQKHLQFTTLLLQFITPLMIKGFYGIVLLLTGQLKILFYQKEILIIHLLKR